MVNFVESWDHARRTGWNSLCESCQNGKYRIFEPNDTFIRYDHTDTKPLLSVTLDNLCGCGIECQRGGKPFVEKQQAWTTTVPYSMDDNKDGIVRVRDDDKGNVDMDMNMAPMDVTTDDTGTLGVRQCCGCCCDFRKAVLIVDGILFFLNLLGTIYAIAAEEHLIDFNKPGNARDVDDFPDDAWAAFVADSALLKFGIAHGFIMMTCYVISIMGTWRFQWKWILPLVIWSAVGGFINFVLTLRLCTEWESTEAGQEIKDEWDCQQPLVTHVLNWVLYGLFLYPHLALMRQYQSKRVTKDSYPKQKSCCCSCC